MKKYVIGFILGILISTTSTVVAANSDIIAKFVNFKFTINGENATLKTQPIVYNGTSYLPVRELSNLLGYDVQFISETSTVVLNNKTTSNNQDVNITTTNTDGMVTGREIVALLEKKYPNATILLSIEGELQIDDKTYTLPYKDENNSRLFNVYDLIKLNLLTNSDLD